VSFAADGRGMFLSSVRTGFAKQLLSIFQHGMRAALLLLECMCLLRVLIRVTRCACELTAGGSWREFVCVMARALRSGVEWSNSARTIPCLLLYFRHCCDVLHLFSTFPFVHCMPLFLVSQFCLAYGHLLRARLLLATARATDRFTRFACLHTTLESSDPANENIYAPHPYAASLCHLYGSCVAYLTMF